MPYEFRQDERLDKFRAAHDTLTAAEARETCDAIHITIALRLRGD